MQGFKVVSFKYALRNIKGSPRRFFSCLKNLLAMTSFVRRDGGKGMAAQPPFLSLFLQSARHREEPQFTQATWRSVVVLQATLTLTLSLSSASPPPIIPSFHQHIIKFRCAAPYLITD
jgi:hypothetical protein